MKTRRWQRTYIIIAPSLLVCRYVGLLRICKLLSRFSSTSVQDQSDLRATLAIFLATNATFRLAITIRTSWWNFLFPSHAPPHVFTISKFWFYHFMTRCKLIGFCCCKLTYYSCKILTVSPNSNEQIDSLNTKLRARAPISRCVRKKQQYKFYKL